MGKYDDAGFVNPMPGTADVTHGDSYAHGSTGGMRPDSGDLGSVPVYSGWTSSQRPPDGGMVPVGHLSTSNDNDPMQAGVISGGVVTPEAAPPGTVCGPPHPNGGR